MTAPQIYSFKQNLSANSAETWTYYNTRRVHIHSKTNLFVLFSCHRFFSFHSMPENSCPCHVTFMPGMNYMKWIGMDMHAATWTWSMIHEAMHYCCVMGKCSFTVPLLNASIAQIAIEDWERRFFFAYVLLSSLIIIIKESINLQRCCMCMWYWYRM